MTSANMCRTHETTTPQDTDTRPPLLTDFWHPIFASSIHQLHNGDVTMWPWFHSSVDLTSVIVPRSGTKRGKQPEVSTLKHLLVIPVQCCAGMKTGLKVNTEEIRHIFISREQTVGQNQNIKIVLKNPLKGQMIRYNPNK